MGKVSLNGQEDIGLVWSRGRPEGAVGKGCGVSTGSESELGEGPRPSAVPPTASCGAGGDGRMTARAVCEVRRRPAVVPPTASCGAGGDRKRTAIEGRVVSIGASRASLSAFGPAVVVLPTASCGAWGGDRPQDHGQPGWRRVHRLVLSVSVGLKAGACTAHGLVWGRGAVVGAVPEGGGVRVGSSSDLGVGPSPSSVPPTASCGSRGDRTMTARAAGV